jgi:hypothetical protein
LNFLRSVLVTISISRHASGLPTQLAAPYENGMNAAMFNTSPVVCGRSQRSGSNLSGEGEKFSALRWSE